MSNVWGSFIIKIRVCETKTYSENITQERERCATYQVIFGQNWTWTLSIEIVIKGKSVLQPKDKNHPDI